MDEEENLLEPTHVRAFDEDSEDLNDDQEAALLADSDNDDTDGNFEPMQNDGETTSAGNDLTEDDDVLDIQADEEVDFDKTVENIIQKKESSESDDDVDDGDARRRGRFLTERKADDLTQTTKVVRDIPESLESVPVPEIAKFPKPNHNANAPNQRRFMGNDYQRNNKPNPRPNRNERRFSPPKYRNQPNQPNIHLNPNYRAVNDHWDAQSMKKNYQFQRNNANFHSNQANTNVNTCQRNLIDVRQAENQHMRPMAHQNPPLLRQNPVVPANNSGYQQMNVNHQSLLPANMSNNNHLQYQNQSYSQQFMPPNHMGNPSVPSTMQSQQNMNMSYMPRGIGPVNTGPQSLLGTPSYCHQSQQSMNYPTSSQQTSFQSPYHQPNMQSNIQSNMQHNLQPPNMPPLLRTPNMSGLMDNRLPFSNHNHNVHQMPFTAANQMPLNSNQNQAKFQNSSIRPLVFNCPPPHIAPCRNQNPPMNSKWPPRFEKPPLMHDFVNRGMAPENKIGRQKLQGCSNALTVIRTVSHEQLQQQGHLGSQNNEANMMNRAKRQMGMPYGPAKQMRMEKPMPSNIKEVPLVGFLPAVKMGGSMIPAITELSQNKSTLPIEDEEDEQTKVLRKQIEEQKQKRERVLKEKEENRRKAAEERRKALQLYEKTEDCVVLNVNVNAGVSAISNIVPHPTNKSPRPPTSASLTGSNLINYASAPQPKPQTAVRMPNFPAPAQVAQQLSGHPVRMKALMPPRMNMQFPPRPALTQGLMTPNTSGQPKFQPSPMEIRNGVVLIENLAAATTQAHIHKLCASVGSVKDVQYCHVQRSAKVTFQTCIDAVNFAKRYHSWDTRELELFDLVEEVNSNFYEILGLQQEATVIDIRKAYRRLSLQLHPDKNKDKNAEEKFRQLVAIYEVLKDLEKRRIYDNILLNGLPTWRQPVYYYRHVRKMSLLELATFLFLLATGAQYLFAWSVYIEKKYELEDILSAKFKKKEKKLRKLKNFEDFSTDAIMAEIDLLPKPKYQDLLPFKLCDYLIYFIKSTPDCYQKWRDLWLQVRLDDDDISEPDDAEYETEERTKKPRRKKTFEIPEMTGEYLDAPDHPPITDTRPEPSRDPPRPPDQPTTWTDEQLVVLIRAINKYPGGVANRWEKIAHFVGRSVLDVVSAAKQLKSSTLDSGVSMSTSVQGITGTLNEHVEVKKKKKGAMSEEMLERQMKLDSWREHSPRGVAKEEHGGVAGAGLWNQKQQKALESALAQFAKGSGERWENIAGCVPGKTKDECMVRYKELAEVVRKKRQLVAR